MSAIHGKSHQAIRFFHEQAAALEVFWIYVSRANYENVAWPSARGLARDTGFDKTVCLNARHWLVAHGALERVERYVQPAWRELPEADRKRRMNLDKNEYYRPTGRLIVNDTTYLLLYFGGQEGSDIEVVEDTDVRPQRTPTGTDADQDGRRPGRTELDSNSELDSSSEDDSSGEVVTATIADVFRFWLVVKQADASAIERQSIPDDVKEYGIDLVMQAMKIAQERAKTSGKRIYSWKYVQPILEELRLKSRETTSSGSKYANGRYAAFINNDPEYEL